MLYIAIALGVPLAFVLDPRQRAHGALLARRDRLAMTVYRRHVNRRRARTFAWINRWRAEHGHALLGELRKGVRGSARHGILARNMDVLSCADGLWTDVTGRSGTVPGFVSDFARDFDEGLFADLAGRLVPVSTRRHRGDSAQGLAWADSSLVA